MSTPEAILLAAKRWLVELNRRTPELARIALRTAPEFRDLTPTQYELGILWLRQHGLLDVAGFPDANLEAPARLVVRAALVEINPVWLADAGALFPNSSSLPLDLLHLGSVLGLAEVDLHEEVLRAWRAYDDSAQIALGQAGELAMLTWLHANIDLEIVQFAGRDDSVGFDFALKHEGLIVARIEVKATTRPNSVVFYLSRNEYHVMKARKNWCLQILKLNKSGSVAELYWLPKEQLADWSPRDGKMATWQSMRFDLPTNLLRKGLAPEISQLVALHPKAG